MGDQSRSERRFFPHWVKAVVSVGISFLLAACLGGGGGSGAAVNPGVGAASPTASATPAPSNLTDVGVQGKTYYVATSGNDNNDGLSLATPFATIEKAVATVQPGDTIEIRGGTYKPTVDNGFFIRTAGTAQARIKMEAYNNEPVVLDAGGKDFVIYVTDAAPYWIFNHLELSGGNVYSLKIDASNIRLLNSNVHGAADDLIKLVQTSDDAVIYGNEIHNNNAAPGANAQGVDIVGADRVWIAHNYVHDIPSIGLYAKGNSRNILMEDNHLENIYYRGLMLGQSTDSWLLTDGPYETYDGIIRNNTVVGTGQACLATSSSYDVKIYNNSCYDVARDGHGAIYVSNESTIGQAGTNVSVENNIVFVSGNSNRPVVKIGPGAMTDYTTLHIDRNLYWSPTGAAGVTFLFEDRGLFGVPIDQWRQATGMDATSIVADPKFADLKALTLLPGSPAINAGIDLGSGVTDDYNNAPRPQSGQIDIGAYEY